MRGVVCARTRDDPRAVADSLQYRAQQRRFACPIRAKYRYDLALSAVAPTRPESRAVQSLLDYRCEALILLGPTLKPSALAALAESQPTVVVARKVSAPAPTSMPTAPPSCRPPPKNSAPEQPPC